MADVGHQNQSRFHRYGACRKRKRCCEPSPINYHVRNWQLTLPTARREPLGRRTSCGESSVVGDSAGLYPLANPSAELRGMPVRHWLRPQARRAGARFSIRLQGNRRYCQDLLFRRFCKWGKVMMPRDPTLSAYSGSNRPAGTCRIHQLSRRYHGN